MPPVVAPDLPSADSAPSPRLGVRGLESFRRRQLADPAVRGGLTTGDRTLFSLLGVGAHQILRFVFARRPDLAALEAWVIATAGTPDPAEIARYHHWLDGTPPRGAAAAAIAAVESAPPALDADDLAHWDRHGFVVLRRAIAPAAAADAARLLWDYLGAAPDDPQSWSGPRWQSIWTPIYQAPELDVARHSLRVRKAFAQLWGTADLWPVIDQMGFNPPLGPATPFMGSPLHWDVSLATPIPFGTQAILYLDETPADQGALRLVPGFHHRIHDWLAAPDNDTPREVPFDDQAVPVPGAAGDLVIWRHELPHGASPNRGARPRLTQYLNFFSPLVLPHPVWR